MAATIGADISRNARTGAVRLSAILVAGLVCVTSGAALAAPRIDIKRTVVRASGSCDGTAGVTVGIGQRVKICYTVENISTNGEEFTDIVIVDSMGTNDTADDITLDYNDLSGLYNSTQDDRVKDDLKAGRKARAEEIIILREARNFRGVARLSAGLLSNPRAKRTDSSASVIRVLPKTESYTFKKTVTWATGTCPGAATLPGIRNGDQIKYCYSVANTGDFDIRDISVSDNLGGGVPRQFVSMVGLKDADAGGTANDLPPGQTALGEIVTSVTAEAGDRVVATGVMTSPGRAIQRRRTVLSVDQSEDASCEVETLATVEGDTSCSIAEPIKTVGDPAARFCYRMTNTGSVPLLGTVIRDNTYVGAERTIAALGTLQPGQTSNWASKVQPNVGAAFKDQIGFGLGTTATTRRRVSCSGSGASALRRGNVTQFSEENGILEKSYMLTNSNCATAEKIDRLNVPKGSKAWMCYKLSNVSDTWGWPERDTSKISENTTLYLIDPDVKAGKIWQQRRSLRPGEVKWIKAGPVTVNNTRSQTAYVHSPEFHFPEFGTFFYIYDNASIGIAGGDLRLTKTPSAPVINSSQTREVSYAITISNANTLKARGARMDETIPTNADFVSATSSQGTCNYIAARRLLRCGLGAIQGRSNVTVNVTLKSRRPYGTVNSESCVTSALKELTTADNCAMTPVRFVLGPTRTKSFWANNGTALGACLSSGAIDAGVFSIRNENADNEIDATTLPVVPGTVVGDNDGNADTGVQLGLGLLNASSVSLLNGQARTEQAQECVLAAQEMIAATCNARMLGGPGAPNLASFASKIRGNCRATTNANALATRIRTVIAQRNALAAYNASGIQEATAPNYGSSTPLNLDADDPTDPRD